MTKQQLKTIKKLLEQAINTAHEWAIESEIIGVVDTSKEEKAIKWIDKELERG
jgi:hypothetical protein